MIWKQLIGGVNFVMVFLFMILNYDNYLAKKNIIKKPNRLIELITQKIKGKLRLNLVR